MKKNYVISQQNLVIEKIKKIKKTKKKLKNILNKNFQSAAINHQIQIYLNSLINDKNKIEKNSKLFALNFPNSFFPKNNLGNFYKQNKKYKIAIQHYLSAIKRKDDILNISIDVEKIIKKNNLVKNKNDYLELISLLNILIINLYLRQLVTFSRPHFADAYTLIDKLVSQIEIFNLSA